MKDYKVASSSTIENLEHEVLILLNKGYIPVGGIIYDKKLKQYHQAVYKD